MVQHLTGLSGKESWIRSLDHKDPLEEEMVTHSRIPVWEVLWTEEPGRSQSRWVTESQTQLSN